DGILGRTVTGVQTCALPICGNLKGDEPARDDDPEHLRQVAQRVLRLHVLQHDVGEDLVEGVVREEGEVVAGVHVVPATVAVPVEIGRASCRERGELLVEYAW